MITFEPAILSSVASAASATSLAGVAPSAPAVASDASFGKMLDQLASQTVDTLRSAEATAIEGVRGKASVQSVVDAILAAERSLQTAIAVRDKAVGAYQEISKMAI
jgi:flagellar hook-basal body complex protein FliE